MGYPCPSAQAELITQAIYNTKFRFCNEITLQRGIANVLQGLNLEFQREVKLTPKDRIDFLVGDSQKIGIEVKVSVGLAVVTRQLWRYADCPEVAELILVTTRWQHQQLPAEMKGKSISVVYLINSFL
jgi:DNA-binding sugar fermentation-stimulating protein